MQCFFSAALLLTATNLTLKNGFVDDFNWFCDNFSHAFLTFP